jgi:hypothetical protein
MEILHRIAASYISLSNSLWFDTDKKECNNILWTLMIYRNHWGIWKKVDIKWFAY